MRVKTDKRRQAIIDAATDVFRELGYARATMAVISRRVGGSKATLYGYFPSKEELFAAAMTEAVDVQSDTLRELLDPEDPDVESVLRRLGEGYLRIVASPDVFNITRTAVAEGVNSGLGELLYTRGPKRGADELADYMAQVMKKGRLRHAEPHLAAAQLLGLYEAGIQQPLLFGAKPTFEEKIVVNAAVDTFLRAYGCEKAQKG